MGAEGNACSAIYLKQGLGIGKGSVMNYLRRVVNVVLEWSMQCYHCVMIQCFSQMLMSTLKLVSEFVLTITFQNVL
jgi:hypothetical protein